MASSSNSIGPQVTEVVAAGCGDFEGAFDRVLAAAKELLKVAFGMNTRFKVLDLDDSDLNANLGPEGADNRNSP